MKTLALFFSLMMSGFIIAQADKEGCKDHELIPSRLPGYYIGECEKNDFSSHVVITPTGEKTIEGKKTVLQYFLKEGSKGVSESFVRKNYVEAVKKQGGKVIYEQNGRGVANVKRADGSEVWMDIAGYVGDGTAEETGHFYLTIVEIAPMEQVITAVSLADELKNTGKTVLYIQFETGKSTIKQESVKIIEQMSKLLNGDKTLKVFIVGHTDNAGVLDANLKLSEERANSVITMLTTNYKVAATQLIGKGVGPLSPIANNNSEAGKKLNRRVEMVKQ